MRQTDVLLVVDVQNDFMPGGALSVPHGDEIVPVINALAARFANVVLAQDWHPPRHVSFVGSHPGRRPLERIGLPYGEQILWPAHCVQGTRGAALHPELVVPHAQLILRKGFHPDVDSYSVFTEADGRPTGLTGYLRERGIARVCICGLATDFCVAWSSNDARRAGFDVVVFEDACRAIDTDGSLAAAWQAMGTARVVRTQSDVTP